MAVACLLTLLALVGVTAGILLGQSRILSAHLAAAGGGLLFGVALFWLIPEIAEKSSRSAAITLAIVATIAMLLVDKVLVHTGHSPRQGVIAPLVTASAIHSFLDGWSVRALAGQTLAGVAVPVGLALHKLPEGLALGWITRKTMRGVWQAVVASAAVELATVLGAAVEPRANESGAATFGAWWSVCVLAVISGSFLFLGVHAVLPSWRRPSVVAIFLVTLSVVGVFRP